MTIRFFIFISVLICCISCKETTRSTLSEETIPDSVEVQSQSKPLPELVAEEIFLKEKEPFNEIIELKGVQTIADTVIFKVGEAQSIIKDNKMLLKTDRSILIFRLPDLIFEGFHGTWGIGPDELNHPQLVPAPNDPAILGYLFESIQYKLHKVNKNGSITPYSFNFDKPEGFRYSEKMLVNIAPDDFIYADDSPTGKSIFRASADSGKINIREVFNLALNPKRKSPFNYIGDFVVNTDKNRMAYAYKYFKIIKFMDLEAQTVRTINFEREEFDENTIYKIDGLDQNITHYWGACAQDEYVYFLYSGRTPYDVVKEANRKNYYIYVEQYDWNGNPVNKFKLDQWGYFTVDEPNKKIYLLSTNHDDPFFIYDLP
ncbi:MAG: TolB-like 6-bladed beta-propeller domain-containing protein [Tannerella sp.]|jgi:hypothetical protein|nr:TolB-like 6-bladed beta-propeller domain-containing protein [Tannerella sp.]